MMLVRPFTSGYALPAQPYGPGGLIQMTTLVPYFRSRNKGQGPVGMFSGCLHNSTNGMISS